MQKNIIFIALFSIAFSSFAQNVNTSNQPIKIVSYNIQFLPRWIAHLKHKPMKRVPFLAQELLLESPDVLVLQEAFSKPCNKKLIELLKPTYPYVAGPANETKGAKLSSGVLILSKTPMKILGSIDFKECEKEDCYAQKGALLIETDIQNTTWQILGTHMEAGGSRDLKRSQYLEIKTLVDQHKKPAVPQLLCGDFNINKAKDLYPQMIQELELSDSDPIGKLKFSADHSINDMNKLEPNHYSLIDYIFVRNAQDVRFTITREIARYQAPWHKKRRDLSDHFALLAKIYIGNN